MTTIRDEWDTAVQGDAILQWRIGSYSLRLFLSGLKHAEGQSGKNQPMLRIHENRERFAALTLAISTIKMCALHPEWCQDIANTPPLNTDQSARAAETLYSAINGELADFEGDVPAPPAPKLIRP